MEGLGGLLALKSLPWTCPLTGAQLGPPCATVGLTCGLRLWGFVGLVGVRRDKPAVFGGKRPPGRTVPVPEALNSWPSIRAGAGRPPASARLLFRAPQPRKLPVQRVNGSGGGFLRLGALGHRWGRGVGKERPASSPVATVGFAAAGA